MASQPATPTLTADEIADRAACADEASITALEGYTSTRRYVLSASRFSKPAEFTVRLTYHSGRGKSFEIISGNTDGIQRRALQRILDGEAETSRKHTPEEMRVSSQNYSFQLLGIEQKNGIQCYVLALKPKRKSRLLLDGKAWISTRDYGVVQMEGRPSERISFWVGKPEITHSFRKFGQVWLLSANHSVADVRLFGRSELSIESSETQVKTAEGDRGSRMERCKHRATD